MISINEISITINNRGLNESSTVDFEFPVGGNFNTTEELNNIKQMVLEKYFNNKK